MNDPKLGPDYQLRFLPTRFDVDGNALDAKEKVCRELACPACHLDVPRPLFELRPLFASIMGSPACGKTYFLASMTWQLRRVLPRNFMLSFGDADPTSNRILNQYEEDQFFNSDQDKIIKLAKTEEQGDLYEEIRVGDEVIRYPRPFLFSLRPLANHPSQHKMHDAARVLCLYDNAGESFLPEKDTEANPVTRHLARSQLLMFLFDPTQDPRFREACRNKTNDVQVTNPTVTARQETILYEVASRIRRYTGLSHGKQHTRPLVVVVTKYDAWAKLLPGMKLRKPWRASRHDGPYLLDISFIESVSRQVRDLLWDLSPEIVSAAEGFCEQVLFVPSSAMGRAPEVDAETGKPTGVRPRDIKPLWNEVPLLYALSQWISGLIAAGRPSKRKSGGHGPPKA